jgi:hypothetical protein
VKIKRLGAIAIVLCTLYARVYILYIFSRDSSKCSKCTRKRVAYNGNFSKTDFDKLLEEKNRLEAARTYIIIEVVSLDKRIKTF